MIGLSLLFAARKKRKYDSAKARRRKGLVRLAVYGMAAVAVLGGISMHSARADVGKAGVSFGRELGPLASNLDGDINHIRINGQNLFISVAFTGEFTTGQILDRYEDHCAQNKSAFGDGEDWANLGRDGQKKWMDSGGDTKLFKLGVIRRQDLEEGVVMCFVKGAESRSTFSESLTAMVKTKDLGAMGKLRYVYVTPTADGRRRRVMTVWTEDSFSIEKIMPADGSEPEGTDPVGVPRMPGTKRMLAADLVGTPFSMHIYRADGTPQAAADWYDHQMYDRGWLVMSPEIKGGVTKGFYKDGVVLNLSATQNENGQTFVAVGVGGNSPDEKAPAATF